MKREGLIVDNSSVTLRPRFAIALLLADFTGRRTLAGLKPACTLL